MLGTALKLIRNFEGLSLNEAAKKTGLSKSYISEIENGQKNPTLDAIEKFSNAFSVPPSSIMFFSETLAEGEKELSFKTRQFLSQKIIAIMTKISKANLE